MSIIGQTVKNAGASQYADLYGGSFIPGGNIVIYKFNAEPSGTRNQNWRFLPVNSDENLYKIQSVLTGLYASVAIVADGQAVVSSLTAFTWQVTVLDNTSVNWIIRVPNTNFVWNVSEFQPLSNVTIATATSNNLKQQWTIANVQV